MQKQYESRAVSVANSNGKTSTPSRTTSTSSEERPKKLSFIQQVNKRKVCENLVRFIRLIDFMMRYSTHMIVSNSLLAIQKGKNILLLCICITTACSFPVPIHFHYQKENYHPISSFLRWNTTLELLFMCFSLLSLKLEAFFNALILGSW